MGVGAILIHAAWFSHATFGSGIADFGSGAAIHGASKSGFADAGLAIADKPTGTGIAVGAFDLDRATLSGGCVAYLSWPAGVFSAAVGYDFQTRTAEDVARKPLCAPNVFAGDFRGAPAKGHHQKK